MSSLRKFTFAISSPDEFLVYGVTARMPCLWVVGYAVSGKKVIQFFPSYRRFDKNILPDFYYTSTVLGFSKNIESKFKSAQRQYLGEMEKFTVPCGTFVWNTMYKILSESAKFYKR